ILMLAASNMISENFYWQEQQAQAVHFQAHQKLFSGHLNNKLLNNCFSFNLFSTYYLPSLNIYVTQDKIIEVILFFIVPSSWFIAYKAQFVYEQRIGRRYNIYMYTFCMHQTKQYQPSVDTRQTKFFKTC
ncbi:hypothetical protein ACJX0J_026302, partial [Zea mays]